MRDGKAVRPCEESRRLVQEVLGDRLEPIIKLQEDYQARYEEIKASCGPASRWLGLPRLTGPA
jgi:hypothetical protein